MTAGGSGQVDLAGALRDVPEPIRTSLLGDYAAIMTEYRSAGRPGDRGTSINAGTLCEAVIRAIDPEFSSPGPGGRLKNLNVDAWVKDVVEGNKLALGELLPLARVIHAVYVIRNKRGVAHVSRLVSSGGANGPERVDASFTLAAARWLMAELVQHQRGLTSDEADEVVAQIADADADGYFDRVIGHRYLRYLSVEPLQRPHELADWQALTELRPQPGLPLLGESKLGYLLASAVHQDVDVDFWHAQTPATVTAVFPLAWLATFEADGWVSARRALEQLQRFPAPVRAEATSRADAEMHAIDHPPLAEPAQAAATLESLSALRSKVRSLPRDSDIAIELLGSGNTRKLVYEARSLLTSNGPDSGGDQPGPYCDQAMAAFLFALCIFLQHRHIDVWRSAVAQSADSARWLAELVRRPARGARARAAAELALYPKLTREEALAEARGDNDEITQELLASITAGRTRVHGYLNRASWLEGARKSEVRQWVNARYMAADEQLDR